MTDERLNELVITYQQTNSDFTFSEIYETTISKLSQLHRTLSSRYGLDESEVESEINLKILETVKSYERDKGNYITYLRRTLRFMKADFIRKKPNNNAVSAINSLEHSTALDDFGNEVNVIETIADDEADSEAGVLVNEQWQLVDYLLSKSDEESRQAILAFKETKSYNKAAKLLGICNKTVERRIRKIADRFDGNQFGSYFDYLTA